MMALFWFSWFSVSACFLGLINATLYKSCDSHVTTHHGLRGVVATLLSIDCKSASKCCPFG